jgi:uncharacterized small protein (DUF1192 family)
MAVTDEDSIFGAPRKAPTHEIGQSIDLLSAPELAERIELLRGEIVRLQAAIAAREATKQAASAFFKS